MPARAPISEEDILEVAKLHDKHASAQSVLKYKFLDLSGLGFLGMGVVGMLRNVRVLLLHTNHISRVDNIGSLVNLEVLNLSTNKIDMLPDARVFANLPRLVVLELNSNRLKHQGTVQGLQGCVRLRYLSLYWNAVTKIQNYRQKMLQLVPSLLILDKIVVNKYLPAPPLCVCIAAPHALDSGDFPHLNVFQDEHPESLLSMDVPEPPVSLQGQPAVDYLSSMKKTVYVSWSSRRIVTLQRCLRGHIARRFALGFLRKKLKIRNAITLGVSVRALGGIQDGIGHECRRLVKCLNSPFGSGQRALLDTLPSLDDEDLWTAKRSCDVYADPRHAYFLQQLLEFAAPQQHDFGWSCVSVWRRSLRWVGKGDRIGGDALLRLTRCFSQRPFLWLRSRPSLRMATTNLVIKRRGFALGKKSIEEFKDKMHKSKEPGLGQAAAYKVRGSPMRLLLIRFTSPELLVRFLNMVALVEAAAASQGSKVRVALLPRAWVRRASAAAAINATVRSFVGRCRHSKLRNLCDLRLRSRSAVVMQRWWRWSVCMKHRLSFLSSLRTRLHALGGGKILMAERQTLEDLDIDRAENSSQLLLETKCEPALTGGVGPRILLKAVRFDMMLNRRLVPKWVNFAAPGAPETSPQMDAGNATPSTMKECVLNLATITDIPRVTVEGRFGLSPLGRRPLVALVYPTPEQASATLIAVHCCTWSVKQQTSSNVLPALIMLKSEACVLLQAVYRAHLSRRGVKPLINVILCNHGTSVFHHRMTIWPSGGQIYYAWAAFGWEKLMYGGTKNFKMSSSEDSEAADAAGSRSRHLLHQTRDGRASSLGRPAVLNRAELANMNRLIAKKMRGDLESALEIADENSLRNMDQAASKCRVLRETANAIKTKQAFADSIDLFPLKKISAALYGAKASAEDVRIIEDQQAAKRREEDRRQRLRNLELMEHMKLLRHDLQQQWKHKHQNLMSERERADRAKAAELKAKVDAAKVESKEHKQTFKEHFDSATNMMRVVASTFAKLAAVENARENTMRQNELLAVAEARRSRSLNGRSSKTRMLDSRAENRQKAEDQQTKLQQLLRQREQAEKEFLDSNIEKIRRSKSVHQDASLPTPSTPYRLMRNIVMKLPFGDELATLEPLLQDSRLPELNMKSQYGRQVSPERSPTPASRGSGRELSGRGSPVHGNTLEGGMRSPTSKNSRYAFRIPLPMTRCSVEEH